MGVPESLHNERSAKSIYLLLCHKKVSLMDNYIRSEFSALLKGCLQKIKQPYYSIYYRTSKQARIQFFKEEVLFSLWKIF
jgi:hypothetical protein